MSLEIRPLTIKAALREVARLHRHLPRVVGGCFAAAVFEDGRFKGVGIAGRPVARMDDDGLTIEITRVAVEQGTHNACSKLYGGAERRGEVDRLSRIDHEDVGVRAGRIAEGGRL